MKHIDSECSSLCSKKQPSCLQSPSKDQLLEFSFENLEKELYQRAPFTHAILQTACVNRRNADKRNEWIPSVGMAAAVLLRSKSTRMNAVQLLLNIFLYHSSWTVCMKYEYVYSYSINVVRIIAKCSHIYLFEPIASNSISRLLSV